jgi:hypothetical protein
MRTEVMNMYNNSNYGRFYDSSYIEPFNAEECFIGENTDYYIEKFDKMYETDREISWNWAAFIIPAPWCFYRKMYAIGSVITTLQILIILTNADPVFYFFIMLFMGMMGTHFYKNHVMEEIYTVKDDHEDVQKRFCQNKGGTNIGAAVVILFLPYIFHYTNIAMVLRNIFYNLKEVIMYFR